MMGHNVIHLRAECKPLEHRSALTPTTAKALIDAGYTVNVERSSERIFDDSEAQTWWPRVAGEKPPLSTSSLA